MCLLQCVLVSMQPGKGRHVPLGTQRQISGRNRARGAPRSQGTADLWQGGCSYPRLCSGQGNCFLVFSSGCHWVITTTSDAKERPGRWAQSRPSLLEAGGGLGAEGCAVCVGANKGSCQVKEQGSFRHCWSGSPWLESFCQDGVQVGSALQPPAPQRPGPAPRPTSGWNCCSVRVWQYWQASPFSHLPGSPHSSPCFTFGHGDDLVQREGGVTWMSGGDQDLGSADQTRPLPYRARSQAVWRWPSFAPSARSSH